MSIFRTIRKTKTCAQCQGSGRFENEECQLCEGTGSVETYSRVNQASAARAQQATKQLPQHQRQEARERLEDHEQPVDTENQPLPKPGKQSRVGKGFIEE